MFDCITYTNVSIVHTIGATSISIVLLLLLLCQCIRDMYREKRAEFSINVSRFKSCYFRFEALAINLLIYLVVSVQVYTSDNSVIDK